MRAYGRIGDNTVGRQLPSLLIKTVVADAHQEHEIERRPVPHEPFWVGRIGLRLLAAEFQILDSSGLVLLRPTEKDEMIAGLRPFCWLVWFIVRACWYVQQRIERKRRPEQRFTSTQLHTEPAAISCHSRSSQ